MIIVIGLAFVSWLVYIAIITANTNNLLNEYRRDLQDVKTALIELAKRIK